MKEKLYIKNFAGIKEAEIELNKINILIGPQATGKSVIAKLLYFFNDLVAVLPFVFQEGGKETEFANFISFKFDGIFPKRSLGNSDFIIKYILGNEYFQISKSDLSIYGVNLTWSEYFKNKMSEYAIFFQKDQEFVIASQKKYRNTIFRSDYINSIYSDLEKSISTDRIFIPAGRSYFASMQKNIFTVLENIKNYDVDVFITEFGSFYDNAKSNIQEKLHQNTDNINHKFGLRWIDNLLNRLLGGVYERRFNLDYVIHNDGRETLISSSSSGQQEVLPLLITLKYLLLMDYWKDGVDVFIEEPEAHLFPSSQRDIVEAFSVVYNSVRIPMNLFITTHSPYILTSFNNLMEAGLIKRKNRKLKELYKIVPKEQILDPKDVSAYSVTHDGVKSIIDPETELILADEIDDVSDQLMVQFDDLMDLR
ncbi:MAG: AAA family ATPase [FCB group bacterium]|nr:AAA family ATPase [FCB group bacterium]